ncbi:hypothetical protein F5148DRAFT_1242880 [Russula earlei]|uniref:Uncharacterized protein n=1 Tax=Russula earlei TaxID=71964 RepID=A0ACC0TV70_9AGAM|nr:hypothetical protein F5148DRAFT_1242880 [Russula earlei]
MWDELSARAKKRRSPSLHDNKAKVPSSARVRLARVTTIDTLPDDVLLEIFDHHRLHALEYSFFEPWEWHRLAHVCRRWRSIIFASPRRLDLRLVYTYRKPVRKTLNCWPALPISIWYPRLVLCHPLSSADEDNVVSALQHPSRICEINLTLTRPLLEKLTPLMRDPLPALEYLQLVSRDMMESLVLPTSFLGGVTPRLCHIDLDGTPFPTLPKLLSSATDLISLRLYEVPNTGYISPGELVAGLDATPKLKSLEISFHDCTTSLGQDSALTSSQARTVLSALTEFQFRGDSDYLEDLVSRIDAHNIEQCSITLLDERMFEIPQLAQFIGRTGELKSSPYRTSIWLWQRGFSITHYFGRHHPFDGGTFRLQIPCHGLARQMNLLACTCRRLSVLVSGVERLDIEADRVPSDSWDETITPRWLELFTPFGGVRRLELIGTLVPSIGSALEQSTTENGGTGVSGPEVFPLLRDLHLRDTFTPPPLESFIAARRLSGHIVSVHYEREASDGP